MRRMSAVTGKLRVDYGGQFHYTVRVDETGKQLQDRKLTWEQALKLAPSYGAVVMSDVNRSIAEEVARREKRVEETREKILAATDAHIAATREARVARAEAERLEVDVDGLTREDS